MQEVKQKVRVDATALVEYEKNGETLWRIDLDFSNAQGETAQTSMYLSPAAAPVTKANLQKMGFTKPLSHLNAEDNPLIGQWFDAIPRKSERGGKTYTNWNLYPPKSGGVAVKDVSKLAELDKMFEAVEVRQEAKPAQTAAEFDWSA